MAARGGSYRRRRGRFGVLYKMLCILLILAALIGGCIVFFRIEKIIVSGSTTYTDQQIITAAGMEMGDNLFLFQKVPTGRKILSELPYIKSVNIRRTLPNAVQINLSECVPVAALKGEGNTWWLMDNSGKLLEQGDKNLGKNYMKITGLTALKPTPGGKLAVSVEEATKLDSLLQILALLEERNMLSKVGSIDLSGSVELHMIYEGRFFVRLPMYSDDFRLLIHTLQAAAEDPSTAGKTGTMNLVGKTHSFLEGPLP